MSDYIPVTPEPMLCLSNNNPTGINQHKECPPKGDARVEEILRECHPVGLTNRDKISLLLKARYEITMSPQTVARRFRDFGLKCSEKMTQELADEVKRQLILDQMSSDPLSRQGPSTIKEGIAFDTGIHLTRQFVRDQMHLIDPNGFVMREPTAKKVHHTKLVALGPHHEWSADGHDKLSRIGFPIYGIRDKWTQFWVLIRVVPNNRKSEVVAYLYLKAVYELGGMPLQSSTDHGSETTMMFGFANALREAFTKIPTNEVPAHRYLRSIHNITVERGWSQLRIKWGDNVKAFWEAGCALYHPEIAKEHDLVQWLWPQLIQAELDYFCDRSNNHQARFDKDKKLPSGASPNLLMSLYEAYHGKWCLQPVDRSIVKDLMEAIGGEELLRFVSAEFDAQAQYVYVNILGAPKVTFENVWAIYTQMLPHLV